MRYNDVATYWEATGAKDKYGNAIYAPPVCVNVRWEDTNKLFTNPMGEELVSVARLFCKGLPKIESYMVRGESKEADPRGVPGSMRIRSIDNSPSIRGNKRLIVAWL